MIKKAVDVKLSFATLEKLVLKTVQWNVIIIIIVIVVVYDDTYYWVYLSSDHPFQVQYYKVRQVF